MEFMQNIGRSFVVAVLLECHMGMDRALSEETFAYLVLERQ